MQLVPGGGTYTFRIRRMSGSSGSVAVRAIIERRAPGTETQGALDLNVWLADGLPVNAAGAAAMALEIGVDFADIAEALSRFGGVARRFDIHGSHSGATFVDDYAHLPTEIAAVLAAARNSGDGWNRVIAVFQPNRFNRIAEIWREYEDAFLDADVVVVTDIFSSGTTPIPGVTAKLIVNSITEAHPEQRVLWLPRREDLIGFVAQLAGAGDVVISMGCGDIATFPTEVLDARRDG